MCVYMEDKKLGLCVAKSERLHGMASQTESKDYMPWATTCAILAMPIC